MASSAKATTGESTKTPAQLLAEQHEAHRVTVEDIEDEDDITHPPPSHGGTGESGQTTGATNGVMSAKAAGKQKAAEKSSGEPELWYADLPHFNEEHTKNKQLRSLVIAGC